MFFDSNVEAVRLEWAQKLRDALKSEDRAAALMSIADEGKQAGASGPFKWFQVEVIRNAAKSGGSASEGSALDGVRQIISHFEYSKRLQARNAALMADESRKAHSDSQEPQATQERIWATVTKGDNQTGDAR